MASLGIHLSSEARREGLQWPSHSWLFPPKELHSAIRFEESYITRNHSNDTPFGQEARTSSFCAFEVWMVNLRIKHWWRPLI
jgi:hypothetical protein